MLKYILLAPFILVLLAGAGLWLNWHLRTPSHDRDWQPLYATLPGVEKEGEVYRLSRVRNWSYGADGPTTQSWLDVTLDPAELMNIYFVVKPFGSNKAVAHTMLAFEFADGAGYVASVEARREMGEDYGGVKAGFLPMHEYMFVWATERDMYANATIFRGNDLYLYRLEIPDEAKQAVLTAMLEETAALERTPLFYNTFFTNCTNVLARAVNKVTPDAVPWNKAWYLPGYAAKYLYDQGMIDGSEKFEVLQERSRITGLVGEAIEVADPIDFARTIRARLW